MKYELIWIPPSKEIPVGEYETFEEARNAPHNADEIIDDGRWQIHVYSEDGWDLLEIHELQFQEWKLIHNFK